MNQARDYVNKKRQIIFRREDYMDNEERMRKLLKAIYMPVIASSEFKEKLLTSLMDQLGSQAQKPATSLWKNSWVWVPVAVIVILAIIGSAIWLLRPESPPTIISPEVPSEETPVTPEGIIAQVANFRLLISDEANAIEYFESLEVTISGAGLLPATEGDEEEPEWILLELEEEDWCTVDLKDLMEENAKEIWSGYVEPGDYTKVFIYIENITWSLESGGDADVKLPSNKLQISSHFTIGEDYEVSFVFDVTVVEAGGSGQYIIMPQLTQSGPDKPYKLVSPEGKPDEPGKPEEVLELRIEGNIISEGTITLVVTDNGSPAEGAKVTVNFNDEKLFQARTDSNGNLEIKLPETAGVLMIEAALREKHGELELTIP
jgi:hypothetical protein